MDSEDREKEQFQRNRIKYASVETILSILQEIRNKAKGPDKKTDRFERQFVMQAAEIAFGGQTGKRQTKPDDKNGAGLEDPSKIEDYMTMDDAELDAAMQEGQKVK